MCCAVWSRAEMVKSIDNMKVLKSVLADSLFDMKEAVKKVQARNPKPETIDPLRPKT